MAELDTLVYNSKFFAVDDSIAAEFPGDGASDPVGVAFKFDGTLMIVGTDSDEFHSWDLGVAWDVTTAVHTGLMHDYGSSGTDVDSDVSSIVLKPDGTRIYATGSNQIGNGPGEGSFVGSDSNIYEWTLSTPWDISTAVYTERFPFQAVDTNPRGLWFRPDGTSFYVTGNENQTIYHYEMSVAWDLNTATQTSTRVTGNPADIALSDDGAQFFFMRSSDEMIQAYDVTVPWFSGAMVLDGGNIADLPALTGVFLVSSIFINISEEQIFVSSESSGGVFQLDFPQDLIDIMGQWPASADRSFKIGTRDDKLEFVWSSTGSDEIRESTSYILPTTTWTHLTFEKLGNIFTIYADGIAIFNSGTVNAINPSIADLYIGKVESTEAGNEFDGSIDEFRIIEGEAVFQAPFQIPSGSVDCVTVIPDISWEPGNLGSQFECDASEFQVIVTGLETVVGLQSFTATGLPEGMVIDSNGNIFGTLPVRDSPPATMEYFIQVTFFVGGIAFLGPSTFSFNVQDRFSDDILQITCPTFLTDEDRTAWKIHLLGLIPNDEAFLPAGDDFGISLTPRLFIMDGLTEDDLSAFQTAMAVFDPALRSKVTFNTLKFATNGRFDVLYYSIEDRGSDVLTFENPLRGIGPGGRENPLLSQLPSPIEPLSINNIRSRLETDVGFDSQFGQELLPDWLPIYEPLVIAAFVIAGRGQVIVDKFDGDSIHHIFKGRAITLDRLDIRRCSTEWPQNGERRLTIKFDDI